MTIDADTPAFPNNIVDILEYRISQIDADLTVVKRRLRTTDGNQTVGLVPTLWTPEQDSYEMLGPMDVARHRPTLVQYGISIQSYVKHADEVTGSRQHSVLASKLRSMLFTDDALRVGLLELSVADGARTERTKKWGIRRVQFLSNELNGSFLYMSILDSFYETETK